MRNTGLYYMHSIKYMNNRSVVLLQTKALALIFVDGVAGRPSENSGFLGWLLVSGPTGTSIRRPGIGTL